MTSPRTCPSDQKGLKQLRLSWLKLFLCGCSLAATVAAANAEPIFNTESPLGFFTNAASRFLMAQFNLDASRIQIYPTNQYTPAVHRLFQLAANIYEATSTNSYPSVFRPAFFNDGTNVFIASYEQVASVTGPEDSQLALPVDAASVPVGFNTNLNVYGIPWVIGARKGLPNFNEFAMESVFQLFRKLQVTRPNTNADVTTYSYNQMFILSLTNQLGVECWNSYTNAFTDPIAIYVTDNQTATLMNDEGLSTNISIPLISGFLQFPNSTSSNWLGYNPMVGPLTVPLSFQIPLNSNITILPMSIYRFNMGGLPYLTTNFDLPFETSVSINGSLFPQPHWYLTASNNLRVIIMDTATNPYRIIDYVQLSGPNNSRDLTSEIIKQYDTGTGPSGNNLWDTNILNGIPNAPVGMASQIGVSLGNFTPGAGSGTWGTSSEIVRENEVDAFRAFFGLVPIYNNYGSQQAVTQAESATTMQTPYTPLATVIQHISWQANDPLVHYLVSDLNWSGATRLDRTADNLTNEDLGNLNQSYRPWGGNPLIYGGDQNPYNLALKDPLVWQSDNWDFPTNESLSGEWLGRVHRGTPWQTVYLKASDILQQIQVNGGATNYIGTNIWAQWTGDTQLTDNQFNDALAMAPVQDWHLASLLSYLMNTNDLRFLFSVNSPSQNAWLGLLNGLTALTNSAPDSQIAFGGTPQFDLLLVSSNSSQASIIANAFELARASQAGGYFHDVGDILGIPQLTEQSPFLNWNDVTQQEYGISDEAYEILPSQLLLLLRTDSIGSVSFANGQIVVRFTGYDNHLYALQGSTNLSNWVIMSINFSFGGGFGFTNAVPMNASPQFFRSLLVQ